MLKNYKITKLTIAQIRYLKEIQKCGYVGSLIAGGAVRDTYLKRPISDIDIFVQHPHWCNTTSYSGDLTNKDDLNVLFNHPKAISTSFNRTPTAPSFFSVSNCSDSMFGSEHLYHIKNVLKDGIKYQIILTSKPPVEYVMDYFFVDLARCYCDGEKLRYTKEFLTDAKNKTLTVAGNFTQHEYEYGVVTYLNKMKKKFPNYRVVDTLKDKYKKK